MEFCIAILEFLNVTMETPKPYGWYHLLCLILTAALTVILCTRFRHTESGKVSKVIFYTALLVTVLEIYKQIVFSFETTDTGIHFDYQWYSFPWQFCSMPMYVGLLIGIFRKGKLHDALCAFLASYGVFAGVCVMLYPADVFIDLVGVNIQTMVCHGSMIVIGVWLLATGYVPGGISSLKKAMAVFAAAVAAATVMNEIAYYTGLTERETFNMFFISRHCAPSLPVYSLVQQVLPYPFCLIVYIGVFSLAAGVILQLPGLVLSARGNKTLKITA